MVGGRDEYFSTVPDEPSVKSFPMFQDLLREEELLFLANLICMQFFLLHKYPPISELCFVVTMITVD